MLLSVSIVFQFPSGFYSGGLLGLQRQVLFNSLRIIFATLRGAGALLVLMFYSQSVIAFFAWMLFVSLLQAASFRFAVWHSLPKASLPSVFDKQELKNIWRFATGITSISIIAALLMQIDKLILSKSFSLEKMGYYILTQSVANILPSFIVPAFTQTLFPQFNRMVAAKDYEALKQVYIQNCKRVSYIIMPVSIFISLFSYKLLLLYTKNQTLASEGHLILSFFVIGFFVNSTLHLPYNLALAFGITKKVVKLFLLLLFLYIPLMYVALLTHVVVYASIAFVLLQVLYMLLLIPMVQKKAQFIATSRWYFEVLVRPALVAGALILPFYFLAINTSIIHNTYYFIGSSFLAVGLTYLVIEKFYNVFGLFKKKAA
jgi:O-antigen/teichoic acid export membrane protein